MADKRVIKRKEGCYLCGTLNAYHNGPGLSPTRNFSRIKRPHIGLNEFDGKWYLIADGVPYPVKHCPNCGRKLDENTKFTVTDGLQYF